jgi:DNA-binding CsgD family transcriptional regulator
MHSQSRSPRASRAPRLSTPGVVGAAVLGLLRVVASDRPLVIAIDDLQWLDEPSAAVIVHSLRRLHQENFRLLASSRGDAAGGLPFGLERVLDEQSVDRLALAPLSAGAVRRIVRLRLGVHLSRVQLRALHEVAAGNPFQSLELARSGVKLDESGALRLPASLGHVAGMRLREMPERTRDALLFVAALADRNRGVLTRVGAFEHLGPAFSAGLLEQRDEQVRFSHPLIRSALWSQASLPEKRAVHGMLANAVEDIEQRARHLAAASVSPNAEVAALLEEVAATLHRRGTPAAAADLLDRALEMTPADDSGCWARRAAAAAAYHAEASHWDSVWELVEQAQERLPAGAERAAICVEAAEMRPGLEDLLRQAMAEAGETSVGVRARIGLAEQAAFAADWDEAVDIAHDAAVLARRVAERDLIGEALTMTGAVKLLGSRLDGRDEICEALAIEQELGALRGSVFNSPRTYEAFALTFGDDPSSARAILRERFETACLQGDDLSAFQTLRVLMSACLRAGDWRAARNTGHAALDLVDKIEYEYGRPIVLGSLAMLEAYEGNLAVARMFASEAVSTLEGFGDRLWSTFARAALVFIELCSNNAAEALEHAAAIADRSRDGRECWWSYHQGDEIEALVLVGENERALERIAVLRRAGAGYGLPRFLAWAERGEGLVRTSEGNLVGAQAVFERALAHHERFPFAFERARTVLAYGHVLRRQMKRRDARAALGEALEAFERLGAHQFADVTREEMKHVGGRPPAGEHELTAAEDRVARLVAAGLSNKEAAAELFLAVSTVEATLTRVYRKLGVDSRSRLAHALADYDASRASAPVPS